MREAVVYCDGSGRAGGGAGGVGFVAVVDAVEYEGSLALPRATNQQAEILAAAFALDQLERCDRVVVCSDSEYLVKGWGWLPGWIGRGWRTRSGPVANQPHWRRLRQAVARHAAVEFRWVRGHAGDELNERADRLAGAASRSAREAAEGMVLPAE